MLFSVSVIGQNLKKFPDDPSQYVSSLASYFGSKLTEDNVLLLDTIKNKWDSVYTTLEKEAIIQFSNKLIKRYARPSSFSNLFQVMNYINSKAQYANAQSTWFEAYYAYLRTDDYPLTRIDQFCKNSILLFSKSIVSSSPSTYWKIRTPNFRLIYKNGLKIQFDETDLVCVSIRDSIVIYKTSGEINFEKQKFVGNGGTVLWNKVGQATSEATANLTSLRIDLTKSGYKADSVNLNYPKYFPFTVFGKIEDQTEHINQGFKPTYPRVSSYSNLYVINDIYPKVNYVGGISVEGEKFIGIGNRTQEAYITLKQNDTIKFKATSKYFVFSADKITSRNAGVAIYLDKDSMYHANLHFTFSSKENKLTLGKTDEYKTLFPYNNSYHRIDMDFAQLYWVINEPKIHFTMSRGSTIGKARFESLNYFNYNFFESLFVLGNIHPLSNLKKYSLICKSKEFSVTDYSRFSTMDLSEMRHLMLQMAFLGFLYYDTETDYITLRQKLFDYLSASIGRIDYDVLNFESVVNSPDENAVLDLRNFDLTINGVQNITLSDSQNIAIYPNNQQIIMKKNRSFNFSGRVDAGLLTFIGKNFYFDYDSFKINLQNVEKLRLRVKTSGVDRYGRPEVEEVSNLIEHLTGDIFIDSPKNKSGLRNFPRYPRFISRRNSYIYYDDQTICNGVYKRDRFYFEADPFEIDSLDNFSTKYNKFKGVLHSDIIPELREELGVLPDYSLGFVHKIFPGEMPMYGGKGTFAPKLTLSSKGLQGNGSLRYLTSVINSGEFQFLPDSTLGNVQEFTLAQSSTNSFPQVSSQNLKLEWIPRKDIMNLTQTDSPFNMYNGEVVLNGKLEVRPSGLQGKGLLSVREAQIRSDQMDFATNSFKTLQSKVTFKGLDTVTMGLVTENITAAVNLASHTGNFEAPYDTATVQFPANKYVTQIKSFNWNMNKEQLVFNSQKEQKGVSNLMWGEKPINETLTGSTYRSTDKHQDSLQFVSSNMVYNYKKGTMEASGVEYFKLADGIILPDSGVVRINQQGRIRKLYNSRILANTSTQFHKIYEVNVDVFGRNDFNGSGKYDYVDENAKAQVIALTEIKNDTSNQIVGTGTIAEENNFTLSPAFDYKGNVNLRSQRKYLEFAGLTRIKQPCRPDLSAWFGFKSTIDPTNVMIPVAPANSPRTDVIGFSGMFMGADSIHAYSVFMSKRKQYNDFPVLLADGFLTYNRDSALYMVGSVEKMKNKNAAGNYSELSTKTCLQKSMGSIDLGARMPHLEMKNAGVINHDVKANTFDLDIATTFDLVIDPAALKKMGSDIDSLSAYGSGDLTKGAANKGLTERWGAKDVAALLKAFKENKKSLPDNFNQSLQLANVHLQWNQKTRSYRSVGNMTVVSVSGRAINKNVEAYLEVTRRRSGDILDLYIKVNESTWYYIAYNPGVLQVLSSNKEFNEGILAIKPDKRHIKGVNGETPYDYSVASVDKKNRFLKRWESENRGEVSTSDDEDDGSSDKSKKKKKK
jgi:hypothetical protein